MLLLVDAVVLSDGVFPMIVALSVCFDTIPSEPAYKMRGIAHTHTHTHAHTHTDTEYEVSQQYDSRLC